MSKLRGELAYHLSPLGPLGDVASRNYEEREWLNTLTLDDAYELLDWIANPVSLPGWRQLDDETLAGIRDEVARYIGEIGQRLKDNKIRIGLEKLLKDPQTRGAAAYGLERLGEPESAHIIAIYVDETDPVVARQIAMTLGELGGSIAYSALETMQQFWDNKSLVYRTIQESLETLESRLI